MATAEEVHYQTTVFLGAALPVLKHIIEAKPKLAAAFAGQDGVVQISCQVPAGEDTGPLGRQAAAPGATEPDGARKPRLATYFIFDGGEITVNLGVHPQPDIELAFGSRQALNAFFTGKLALPKIRGIARRPRLFAATLRALLTMSALLGAKTPPADPAEQALLTKCLFYVLSSGISQLNKAGHPLVRKWSTRQPDRVYALRVAGRPELGAYVRVKGGRTKAARGEYTRSRPFFAMSFAHPRAALGTLLEIDDMIAATSAGDIEMQGAPEYGAELGEIMLLIGSYTKETRKLDGSAASEADKAGGAGLKTGAGTKGANVSGALSSITGAARAVAAKTVGRARNHGIHHAGVTVADFGAAVSWYRDMFGFQLVSELYISGADAAALAPLYGREGLEIHLGFLRSKGGTVLEIFEFSPALPPAPVEWTRPGFTHVALAVTNVPELKARLEARGVEFLVPVQFTKGAHWTFFRDPDGNLLELIDLHSNRLPLKYLGGLVGGILARSQLKKYR